MSESMPSPAENYADTVVSRLADSGIHIEPLQRALPAYITVSALMALAVERGLDLGMVFSAPL